MWEDKANANGGKWVLTMKSQPQLLDRCWSWLAMALVGEELDEGDEICGAGMSVWNLLSFCWLRPIFSRFTPLKSGSYPSLDAFQRGC